MASRGRGLNPNLPSLTAVHAKTAVKNLPYRLFRTRAERTLYSGKPGTLWGEISSIDRGSFRFKPTQEEFNILGCIKMNEAVMLG